MCITVYNQFIVYVHRRIRTVNSESNGYFHKDPFINQLLKMSENSTIHLKILIRSCPCSLVGNYISGADQDFEKMDGIYL